MSFSLEPHQEWNSWDQLLQEDPRAKRSSNETVLLLHALCSMHYANYPDASLLAPNALRYFKRLPRKKG